MALSPPLIDGVIPAQYGRTLEIPFRVGSTVGTNDIQGFILKIKTIQTNTLKYTLEAGVGKWNKELGYVTFTLDKNHTLTRGTHYKIQMAFEGGSFSTVGVFKYTYQPKITVSTENNNPRNILGCYTSRDLSEKLYSSYFTVYKSAKEIFYQSDELIHNSDTDEFSKDSEKNSIVAAYERLNLIKNLETGKKYYVQFHCKTINDIEISSNKIEIIPSGGYPIDLKLSLTSSLDYDNGRIKTVLSSKTLSKLTGKYKLVRTDSKINFDEWTELLEFNFKNQKLPSLLWYDNTIEQGVSYQYAIFEENEFGCFSSKVTSEIVFADFEDLFLSDGNRQLKIRFNPKVTSIKNTIQENKQDTMGGKYPFIFRNGYVNYKEFPISGLISYLQDENNLFYDKNNFLLSENQFDVNDINTNLNSENIYNERLFKMEVLDWLTNGKEKIFRSPAEGNYLVRLMNISLSPVSDGLNRMLHTFSATAYEIADYTIEELLKYNYIKSSLKTEQVEDIETKVFNFMNLIAVDNLLESIIKSKAKISSVNFLLNSDESKNVEVKINGNEVNVYHNFTLNNTSITSISAASSQTEKDKYSSQDLIVIKYKPNPASSSSKSSSIKSIYEVEIPCYQVFGEGDSVNLLTNFVSSKDKDISSVFYGQISYSVITIYYKDKKYYKEESCNNNITPIAGVLYKVLDDNGKFKEYAIWNVLKPAEKKYTYSTLPTFSCSYTTKDNVKKTYTLNANNKGVQINGELKALYASPGLIIELGIRLTQTEYSTQKNALNEYKKAQDTFKNYKNNEGNVESKAIISYINPASSGSKITKTKLQHYGDVSLQKAKTLSNALGGK